MSNKKQEKVLDLPKPKKLTLSHAKQKAKDVNKKERYDLNDEVYIDFYPLFPQGKINDLMQEYQDDMVYMQEKGYDLEEKEGFLFKYINFLCIKYFTDLGKEFGKKVETKIQQIEFLEDAGYLDQIINDVFMVSELHKVYDEFGKLVATHQFFERVNNKTSQYLGYLEHKNKELMEQMEEQLKIVEDKKQ